MSLGKATAAYALLMIGLQGSLAMEAQQPATPVSVGAPGVAPLRLVTYVPPVYPQIALSAVVSGEVVLEATIGTDGLPRDIRVSRSIPLLDQAVIDATRQWRFEPPTVSGVSTPVRVPISVSFLQHGGAGPLPISSVQSPSLPRDFAVVFASTCEDGSSIDFNTVTGVFERKRGVVSVRVELGMEVSLLESIHDVIDKTGLMANRARLAQWPDVERQPQISDAGIRVVLRAGKPAFIDWSDGPTPRQYFLDLRMNGTWTRLHPPASWPYLYRRDDVDERDRERARKTLQIVRLVENTFSRSR